MSILEITSNNFQKEIENSNELILIEFYGTYCAPCKLLENEIKQLDLSNIKICKINIDNELNLALKYGVMSVPSLIFINKNNILEKHNGFLKKDEILKKINSLQNK